MEMKIDLQLNEIEYDMIQQFRSRKLKAEKSQIDNITVNELFDEMNLNTFTTHLSDFYDSDKSDHIPDIIDYNQDMWFD